jgi:tetratricopeptide (TPR) repeat protein
MKKFCTILFLFTLHFGQAQFDPSKVNKKAAQLYSKALELAQGDHFREAIQVLQQAVKIEPGFEDAYLSIAGMYGELKNYQGAIDNYEKARSIDSEYFKDYNITYSINLAGKGEFEKALDAIKVFLTIPNLNEKSRKAGEYRKRCYSFAIEYAKNNNTDDYKFEPLTLVYSINAQYNTSRQNQT